MTDFFTRRATKYLLLLAAVFVFPQASFATDFMKEGMAEYAAGNFSDASGHFGGALSTDFNNATLHYYLGSCYAHMKQKEAAVREFRIAYALEPEKEVGRFSKQALETFGFDPSGSAEKKVQNALPGASSKPIANTASGAQPVVAEPPKPKTMLDKQTEDLKNLRIEQARLSGEDAQKQGERFVEKSRKDMLDQMRYVTRRGTVIQPQLTGTDAQSLENLKKMYDAQKSSLIEGGARQGSDIQNTAAALRDQMNEQAKAGKVHLSPSGTNLYVRNYEMPASTESKPPVKSPGVSGATTK